MTEEEVNENEDSVRIEINKENLIANIRDAFREDPDTKIIVGMVLNMQDGTGGYTSRIFTMNFNNNLEALGLWEQTRDDLFDLVWGRARDDGQEE